MLYSHITSGTWPDLIQANMRKICYAFGRKKKEEIEKIKERSRV